MTAYGRAARGAYRCGCGARVQVASQEPTVRTCWYHDCPEPATTQPPLSLCVEHQRDAVNHLAHLIVRFDWGAVAAASKATEEFLRPLDGYGHPATAAEGWVYFMRRERFIKIGTTTDLRRRAQTLNATVVAKRPGSYSDEAQLHRQFASLRRHGEWFEPGPELLALVNELRAAEGLPPLNE
jgi:hypothetical protein